MSTKINGKEMIEAADCNEIGHAGTSRIVAAACDVFFAKHGMQASEYRFGFGKGNERAFLKRRNPAPKGAR